MDEEEQAAMDAAWAQQSQDERRRLEDEAIERCRPLQKQFRRELEEFEREAREDWKRIRTYPEP